MAGFNLEELEVLAGGSEMCWAQDILSGGHPLGQLYVQLSPRIWPFLYLQKVTEKQFGVFRLEN